MRKPQAYDEKQVSVPKISHQGDYPVIHVTKKTTGITADMNPHNGKHQVHTSGTPPPPPHDNYSPDERQVWSHDYGHAPYNAPKQGQRECIPNRWRGHSGLYMRSAYD